MRAVIIIFAFSLFALAPVALAGSVPSGGACPSGTSDCVSGLGCVNGVCQNLSPTTANSGTTLINPLNTGECAPNGNCLMNFLNSILDFVIDIGAVVVVLMMVYVGYLFVTARGEPAKISKAREAFLWTIVGSLILLGAKAISLAIEATVKAIGG